MKMSDVGYCRVCGKPICGDYKLGTKIPKRLWVCSEECEKEFELMCSGDDDIYHENNGTNVSNGISSTSANKLRKFVCNGCQFKCELVIRAIYDELPSICPFDDRLVDWKEVSE